MSTKEALYQALLNRSKADFSKVASKVFEDKLEDLVWEYYQSIEEELKEQLASSKQVDD